MLTNYQTVKASIDRLKKIEAHEATRLSASDLPKKEPSALRRELDKLQK